MAQLNISLLAGDESKKFLAGLTKQIDRLEALTAKLPTADNGFGRRQLRRQRLEAVLFFISPCQELLRFVAGKQRYIQLSHSWFSFVRFKFFGIYDRPRKFKKQVPEGFRGSKPGSRIWITDRPALFSYRARADALP